MPSGGDVVYPSLLDGATISSSWEDSRGEDSSSCVSGSQFLLGNNTSKVEDDGDGDTTTDGSTVVADSRVRDRTFTATTTNVLPDSLENLLTDEPLDTLEQQQTAIQFGVEHRIFLKAALALLMERDLRAPTLGMMDPMVLKSGPLKKASHLMNGVWKVKYVEIRRGMFSYYENAINDGGEILRKNIPLQANDCTCRAVRLHQKALKFTPRGAILELAVAGQKRLWLANSRPERQSWMQAIHTATVGGSVTTANNNLSMGGEQFDHHGRIRHVSPRSPFKLDLRFYLKIQSCLRQANNKQEYIAGLRELENRSIRVPINWIAKQAVLSTMSNNTEGWINFNGPATTSQQQTPQAFKELGVDLSVEQLWRDLQRDSVSINNVVWHGNQHNGPESIVGAVVHAILRAALQSTRGQSDMMESQALAYARDILLAGNRTRSGGDSYFCITTLCNNAHLVVVTPSGMEAQPVALTVSEETNDAQPAAGRVKNKSGWMKKRIKLQRSWKSYFFVLSEGTLSFYDGAVPQPHGLRGVILLTEATIQVNKSYSKDTSSVFFVVTVAAKDGKEHILRLEHEGRLVEWLYVLECEAKSNVGEVPTRFLRRKSSAMRSDDEAPPTQPLVDVKTLAEQATMAHAKRLGLDMGFVKERIAGLALQTTTSAVRISIQACTEYKICTNDPSGLPEEDTWGILQTHFQQTFRVTGGSSGRITRGEEIVRVSLLQYGTTVVSVAVPHDNPPRTTRFRSSSHHSRRTNTGNRIFRNFNNTTSTAAEESMDAAESGNK